MRNINLQRVPFHESEITSFQDDDGTVWVSLIRACESLDIEYNNQYKKITSSDLYRTEKFTYEGGSILMMDAKGLTRWLMSIQPGKVKEASRDRLIRWQDESYEALRAYWFDGIALNPNATDEQKEAAKESIVEWYLRRTGMVARKGFVSTVKALGFDEKYPDAYQRATTDLYERVFNANSRIRDEAVEALVKEKGSKTFVDPDGNRRKYNFRDTLTAEQLVLLTEVERRISERARGMYEGGADPDIAYGKARDRVLAEMGITTPF